MQGKDVNRSHLALVSADREGGTAQSARPQAPAGQSVLSPFSAAVPDRYFETDALRDCHGRVARAALDSDTVAVVEGERGCGKTTFVRMLQKRVGTSRDLCYIDVRIPQGERYVLARLQRAFCPDQPAQLDALIAQLIERGRRNGGCLIVVDDADKLSVFAIRLLFMLKHAVMQAGSQLGVVITMSPLKLDAMLALPSFSPYRTRGLTRVELPHFSAQETADYLRTRIESAGMAAALSFDSAQVQRIHQASGGLPQHIKRVAGELLDGSKPQRYRSARRQQRLARFKTTLIPVAAIVLPLICIGFLLQAIFKRPADDVMMERLMSTSGIEAAGTAVPIPAAPAVPVVTGAVDRAPAIPAARQDKTPDIAPVKPTAPPVPSPASVAAAAAPVAPAAVVSPRAAAAPAPEAAAKPEPAPAAVSATIPADQQQAADTASLDGNVWLRAQDPAFYTIQLAGAEQRKDVQEFIDKYALPGKVVVVEVLRNGKVWHMVLYNSYRTWGEAQRELSKLPPQIHRNDPFSRRFASVQAIALGP